MTRQAGFAVGLWMLLAVAVFSVTFDWQARVAAHQFVQSQVARHQRGEPVTSINDGYTPMVRAAARRSTVWLAAIAAAGTAATIVAGRQASGGAPRATADRQ